MSLLLLLRSSKSAPEPEPTPADLDRRPPLELDIQIETAEGANFTLSADALKASDVPTGITFSTQRGEGFSTASFTLARDIFRDYPDLNLLDTVRFIGRQEDIAYEGRVQAFPRSSNPQTITVQCVGWMTYLKSVPMAALIIDRRLAGWVEPSTQRKANLLASNGRFEGTLSTSWEATPGAYGPGAVFTFQQFDGVYAELGEASFYAGGQDIGELRFDFRMLAGGADTNWETIGGLASDDIFSASKPSVDLDHTTTAGVVAAAPGPGYKYAFLHDQYNGPYTGASNVTSAFLYPRAVGTHGLTPHGTSPEEGYYLSDIIRWILAAYAPKIEWAGEEDQLLIQQATWHDKPAKPYDAILELNNLSLYEINVWEERKLYREPADLTGPADWQIRTSDPGVTVNFQGDSIESFASGVIVTYSDFFGHTYRLTPDSHPELGDENENNAAARHGEEIWIEYQIPWQCLEAEALQIGRAYLADNNRPKRPGSFTVQGHIQDAAGHWHAYWAPRSSQTISIMDDLYEGEPRLIYATSPDEESKTTTITVDAPPTALPAFIARQQLALEARNLSN